MEDKEDLQEHSDDDSSVLREREGGRERGREGREGREMERGEGEGERGGRGGGGGGGGERGRKRKEGKYIGRREGEEGWNEGEEREEVRGTSNILYCECFIYPEVIQESGIILCDSSRVHQFLVDGI